MEPRIPYDVVYCTSQDDDFPIEELDQGLSSNAAGGVGVVAAAMPRNGKGWQSARNAKMPQAIVLRFPGNVELKQLRILSHECKIASRVEVRLFALKGKHMEIDPPSFRAANFTKLGAVEFNSNEQSQYRSKERKTIHMQSVAYFVKLLFNTPHRNPQNVFNQIGVYSIECNGRILSYVHRHCDKTVVVGSRSNSVSRVGSTSPLRSEERSHGAALGPLKKRLQKQHQEEQSQQHTPRQHALPLEWQQPPSPHAAQQRRELVHSPPLTPVRDIIPQGNDIPAFRSVRILEFEEFFIRRSEELLALKDQAVTVEDFEIAKQCRDRLNLMNRRSKRIYQIEQDKVQAIIDEDFDAAKEAKRVMDAMIEKVYKDAQLPQPRPDFNQYECVGDTFDENFISQALRHPAGEGSDERNRDKNHHHEASSGYGDSTDHEYSAEEAGAYAHKKKGKSDNSKDSNNGGNDMDMDEYDEDDANEVPLVSNYAQRMADMVREVSREIDKVDPPPEQGEDDSLATPKMQEAKLQSWERKVAEAVMAASSDTEYPNVLNSYVKSTREALDLVSAVGMFTTCCFFSKRFKLREAVLEVLMEQMKELYQTPPAVIEEVVLRFLDMNGHGLQDTIPNVVAACCAFVRMVLADEHQCLHSVLAPVVNLLPRLLCCAADANPRVRDEALTTLTLCIQTPSLTNPTILTAVLSEPVDKERRRLPSSGNRVQIARLTVLEQLVTAGHMGLRNHTGSVWTKLLQPCINHQSGEVRELALKIIASLLRERKIELTEKRITAIDNAAIREQIKTIMAEVDPLPSSPTRPPSETVSKAAKGKATPKGEKPKSGRNKPSAKEASPSAAVLK